MFDFHDHTTIHSRHFFNVWQVQSPTRLATGSRRQHCRPITRPTPACVAHRRTGRHRTPHRTPTTRAPTPRNDRHQRLGHCTRSREGNVSFFLFFSIWRIFVDFWLTLLNYICYIGNSEIQEFGERDQQDTGHSNRTTLTTPPLSLLNHPRHRNTATAAKPQYYFFDRMELIFLPTSNTNSLVVGDQHSECSFCFSFCATNTVVLFTVHRLIDMRSTWYFFYSHINNFVQRGNFFLLSTNL